MIIFSSLYGVRSYGFSYYGEMITYLGMTMPMAVFSLISWLKNPYKGKKSEVEISKLKNSDKIIISVLTVLVTTLFYFILSYFNTANIIPSTVSVTTSFAAACLTFRRSPYFALIYAMNDVVLIVLWVLASMSELRYISVVVCFVAFFFNDVYCFVNWQKMKRRQKIV